VAWSLFLLYSRLNQYADCYRIFQERFLWFCKKESSTLDPKQREIVDFLKQNTPWLALPAS